MKNLKPLLFETAKDTIESCHRLQQSGLIGIERCNSRSRWMRVKVFAHLKANLIVVDTGMTYLESEIQDCIKHKDPLPAPNPNRFLHNPPLAEALDGLVFKDNQYKIKIPARAGRLFPFPPIFPLLTDGEKTEELYRYNDFFVRRKFKLMFAVRNSALEQLILRSIKTKQERDDYKLGLFVLNNHRDRARFGAAYERAFKKHPELKSIVQVEELTRAIEAISNNSPYSKMTDLPPEYFIYKTKLGKLDREYAQILLKDFIIHVITTTFGMPSYIRLFALAYLIYQHLMTFEKIRNNHSFLKEAFANLLIAFANSDPNVHSHIGIAKLYVKQIIHILPIMVSYGEEKLTDYLSSFGYPAETGPIQSRLALGYFGQLTQLVTNEVIKQNILLTTFYSNNNDIFNDKPQTRLVIVILNMLLLELLTSPIRWGLSMLEQDFNLSAILMAMTIILPIINELLFQLDKQKGEHLFREEWRDGRDIRTIRENKSEYPRQVDLNKRSLAISAEEVDQDPIPVPRVTPNTNSFFSLLQQGASYLSSPSPSPSHR